MKLLMGLFMAAKRRLMTTDSNSDSFKSKLDELIEKKDSLSAEDIGTRVDELKKLADELPESDGKSQLLRYLEDFREVKSQDAAVAAEAAGAVAEQFEKLYSEALQDAPEVKADADSTAGEDEIKKDDSTSDADDDSVKKVVDETKAPEDEKKVEDEEPKKSPTLEEIYQYVKKRAQEEAGSDDNANDNKDEITTDGAPKIPVTLGGAVKPAEGSLGALFEMAKGR